jgi:hypothetical protein
LYYIKDHEIPNYIDAISYKSDYYQVLSDNLKQKIEKANTLKIISKDKTELFIE